MMSRRFTMGNRSVRWAASLLVILPTVALALSPALLAQAVQISSVAQRTPKPGAWTQLGTAQGGSSPALVHESNGKDMVVWTALVENSKYYYEAVELKPKGGMASSPKNVFGGSYWGGITFAPSLLSDGGKPLLVFEGSKDTIGTDPYSHSCIVGDLLSGGSWKLQSWSLSASCVNPDHFGAAITQNGTISAAWPGGWAGGNGVLYRNGVSPSIPAAGTDQHISTAIGDSGSVGATTDARTQHVFAAFTRFFSKPATKDGLWVADLSKGSAVKAPDTGTNTVASYPEPVAVASPSGRGGVYLAYCNNTSPCSKVELWRDGAKTAVTVPKSASPRSVSLSAGPSGRLWVAWWSSTNGTVSVVRTNEAGNAFGPVATHPGPAGCKGDANASIRISSGSQQRLDVLLTCTNFTAPATIHISATQSLVPLQVSSNAASINHKKGGTVTFRVSDVGDPVQGARVTANGKKGTTNAKGQVTFRFPRGSRTGSFKVVASKTDYLNASTSLRIT